MNRFFSAKTLVTASVALGAVAAASVAHAGTDVILSIGFNAPYGHVQPAPVYVQPRPAYVQPQTVYYGHDRRYERRGPFGDWDRDGIPNRFDRDSRFYDPRVARGHRGWGDVDRDGVPNRFDRDSRFYDPRVAQGHRGWGDADHDGVPNRFDHAPTNPYRY